MAETWASIVQRVRERLLQMADVPPELATFDRTAVANARELIELIDRAVEAHTIELIETIRAVETFDGSHIGPIVARDIAVGLIAVEVDHHG